MNPLLLFLFCFLAISFSLILIQKDLSKWQKFSLVMNPALLALCILILISKSQSDRNFAADVAPVVNTSIDLLAEPGSPEALEAAERIRAFVDDPADKNWQNLNSDLQKIVENNAKCRMSGTSFGQGVPLFCAGERYKKSTALLQSCGFRLLKCREAQPKTRKAPWPSPTSLRSTTSPRGRGKCLLTS